MRQNARDTLPMAVLNHRYVKWYLLAIGFLFLVSMQYYQPNMGGYALNIPTNSVCWIAVSVLIAAGAYQWLKTGQLFFCTTDIVSLIVIFALLVPLLWSESPWRQLSYDRYIAIVAFWLLMLSHRQFVFTKYQQQLFWAIIVSGILIQCSIGVVQFFMADQLYIIKGNRPLGTIQQVNVYASLIATGLGISLHQLLSERLSTCLKYLHMAMIFFAGLLEVLVQSRTGLLGSIVVVTFLSIIFLRQWKIIAIAFGLLFLGVLVALIMQSQKQVDSRAGLAEVGHRGIIYKVSIELIKQRPLLGHGMGRFSTTYHDKQAEFFVNNPDESRLHSTISVQLPHNELLYWWVEGGMLPIVALLLFAAFLSIKVWFHGELKHKGAWICTIPIVVHTQTEYPLYHSVVTFALLGLLISCSVPDRLRSISPSFSLIPLLFVVVMPLLVILIMVTNLHTSWLLTKHLITGKPDYLFQTINPFTQRASINFYKSNVYFLSGDMETLSLAEKNLVKEVKLRPSHLVYWTLYNVQKKMGDEITAQQTYAKAKYLFPSSSSFNDL